MGASFIRHLAAVLGCASMKSSFQIDVTYSAPVRAGVEAARVNDGLAWQRRRSLVGPKPGNNCHQPRIVYNASPILGAPRAPGLD